MLFVHVSGELGVWTGVGCSCPPVRNDIVTPRFLGNHLTFSLSFCFLGDLTTNAILTSTKKDAKTNYGAKFAAKRFAKDITSQDTWHLTCEERQYSSPGILHLICEKCQYSSPDTWHLTEHNDISSVEIVKNHREKMSIIDKQHLTCDSEIQCFAL